MTKKKQRVVREAAKPGTISKAKIRAAVKKIKEEDFNVELTKDMAGSPQKTVKAIAGASSASDAITKAKLGDPQNYDQIIAKKKKAGSPVRTDSQTTAKTNVNTQGMAGLGESKKKTRKRKTVVQAFKLTESYKSNRFEYPYSIALPQAFNALVESVVKKIEGVRLSERYARVYIQIPNANSMDALVENLVKKAKGKGKDPKAEIVINGIMGSIK